MATRGHLDYLPVGGDRRPGRPRDLRCPSAFAGKIGLAGLKETGPWTRAAPAAALAVFLMGAATFALASACWPHGDWDAWSVWNLHARFLYRGGEQWTSLFSKPLSWSPSDYPLLLPASVMRSWVFAGGETVAGPILVAFVFMAGISLLLFSGLALLRGKLRASLAAIVLAGTPFFMGHAASQYADVPLAFFYLATLVLLCLADRRRRRRAADSSRWPGWPAAWRPGRRTRGCFSWCASCWRESGLRPGRPAVRTCWSRMRPFLAGLLPVVLIMLFFKIRYAPPNDILGPAGRASALERILTPSRYAAIGEWFLKQVFAFGRWDELRFIPVSPVPLLLGALVLFGIRPDAKRASRADDGRLDARPDFGRLLFHFPDHPATRLSGN